MDSFLSAIASGGAARACIVLTLLCALLYLPGLTSVPPTDRDEARFMQATKQMIETGDYINIHFQDEPRNKKPAGIHWLQAAAVKIAGQDLTSYWPYRLPSVVAAWLAVIACYGFGVRLFDRKTGVIAGAVLATSFMVVIEAHIAKTDAMLLAVTTVSMGALAAMYVNRHQGTAGFAPALMFWIALAASTLIKGPVSLAVVLVTIIALGVADRDIRWLKQTRPLIGLPLAFAITLPWLLATSGSEGGNNFLVEAVRGDLIPKLIGGQESHGAPPGAHLFAGLITAWPWSLLLPFAIVLGWRQRTQPAIRFCLAWLIGTWALFEVVPTKLPHYTLPAFPAFALLIAAAVQSDGLREAMRSTPGRLYRGLWALITVSLGAGVIFASAAYGAEGLFLASTAAAILVVGAAIALFEFRDLKPVAAATAAAVAFAAVLAAGVVPGLNDLTVSKRLAATIAPYRATSDRPVAMAGYSEPSAVFLLGTETILTSTASVTDYLLTHPGAVGVIESAHVPDVTRAVAGTGGSLRVIGDVEGYNYSRGDPVALSVVTFVAPEVRPQ
jgi:4-amino-4-deoxy-L-arabinose transferase-like glycosyltransferase